MASDIEFIRDDNGLALFGDPAAIDRFLQSQDLSTEAVPLPRMQPLLATGAAAAQAGAEINANSGRWVKLTKESARAIEKQGLRKNKNGVYTGVLKGDKGQIAGFVEFVRTPGALLSNPAVLTGAAGIMTQLAMQQAMAEITDYLATIDEKVDDILRAQKDTAVARTIGVGFVIDEAMTLRKSRGRVDEVTWSKVQGASATVAETQAYALRQLDALTDKLEKKSRMGDIARTAKTVEPQVREWLAVLARCFQLHDGLAVLELDRVLDASPDELDAHRLGLQEARQERMNRISVTTLRMIDQMNAAAASANTHVLLNPIDNRTIVGSSNRVCGVLTDFHEVLGLDAGRAEIEARRWSDAAWAIRDKILDTGGEGVDSARRFGTTTAGRARATADAISGRVADRTSRRRRKTEADEER